MQDATPKDDSNLIRVLDHGYVRLVDHMGSDLSVVRSARVSYDADWRAGDSTGSDTRLINYLARHNHTSPFEAVTLTFEIKAPIFVLRQWHRHRTWSYNEISARYTELPNEFYVPDPSLIGVQSQDNKQMRVINEATPEERKRGFILAMHIAEQCESAFFTYKQLIVEGVPRELARTVLPVATYSRMFATVNLHNLVRFLKLRQHEHSQYEIRVYADAMEQLAATIAPISIAAFMAE